MRVVVVTGCSSGFGLRSAVAFARRGDNVVATMRNLAKGTELEKAAADAGVAIAVEQLDVSDPSSVTGAFDRILKREGRVDVLVNNAGVARSGPIELLEDADWAAVFGTNLFGTIRCIRAVLPAMRQRKNGAIINVSSSAGRVPSNPIAAPYNASKCALGAISESLAMEVEPFGIRVRCIEPGFFRTAIGDNAVYIEQPNSPYAKQERAVRNFYEQSVAGGADPEQVADAIVGAADDTELWPVHRPVGADADLWLQAAASMSEREWVAMVKATAGLP